MISVVVLTKNEEKNIEACLKTLKWCDEVVVVDDNSSDKTVEIAGKLGAKVFSHKLNNDFSAQRNFALRQAQGDWVLFVDADERVSPQLRSETVKITQNLPRGEFCVNGFYLRRMDFIFGKRLEHGETAGVRLIRLGRKGEGEWKRPVHETWDIKGEVGELKSPLFHFPHQTVSEFLESINFFSTLDARAFYDEGKRTTLLDWFKPPVKFIQNWILRLGFLDGMPGFIVALMMSFHSFLVRAKLYLLWKQGGGWKG